MKEVISSSGKKSEVIEFIKNYFTEIMRVPSIQIISDKIAGVNRSNFYNLFSGIGEACDLAGVPRPSKRMNSTKKASKKRREKKPEIHNLITLTEDQTKKLLAIGYLEGRQVSVIVDELLDDLRFLKTDFKLDLLNIGILSKFLKECEESGLTQTQILNCMHKFIRLGVDGIKMPVFNLLIDLLKYRIRNKLDNDDLGSILKSKKEVFLEGYNKCIEDSLNIIISQLPISISPVQRYTIAKCIQGELIFNLRARARKFF